MVGVGAIPRIQCTLADAPGCHFLPPDHFKATHRAAAGKAREVNVEPFRRPRVIARARRAKKAIDWPPVRMRCANYIRILF